MIEYFKVFILFVFITGKSYSQNYLSNLNATADDPVYTVYAAPVERSNYKIDQAYSLTWFDPGKGIGFSSVDGGSLFAAFKYENSVRVKLSEYYKTPVITASYSDFVKLYFYPFRDIRVEQTFAVYSSRLALNRIRVKNESSEKINIGVIPYFQLPSGMQNSSYLNSANCFVFDHNKKRDGWMKEHNIPYAENLRSVFMISEKSDNIAAEKKSDLNSLLKKLAELNEADSELNRENNADRIESVAFLKNYEIMPGETIELNVFRGIEDSVADINRLVSDSKDLMKINPEKLLRDDEKKYSHIPEIKFENEDWKMLYWNAFSLIKQCMMGPEGEAKYNYYVFSREPKWGWGYGGQVFHESLVMLAYAFMDPVGAMNSQRVYFQRQHPDGYINYRTGPYLNESIEYRGQLTSSAPWYNYENYEIYKITKDKKFLAEAYESGKRFYNFYVSRRDSNGNGLCAWGGEAELESVRDARVAVWDKVGWASNFEGPDVNSMLVMETSALAGMAEILGKKNEAEKWKSETDKRKKLINQYLWDEATGFYYNANKKDQSFTFHKKDDLKIKEIIGFLPMWANVADSSRAAELMKSLLNKNEFWRSKGIPSLSAADDYYNPIGYWNGPVWIQWQYLVFRGLVNYGYINEARELAGKVLNAVASQLKKDHYFWEFYSADDEQAGWNKTYIWTGIVARFMIDLNKLH